MSTKAARGMLMGRNPLHLSVRSPYWWNQLEKTRKQKQYLRDLARARGATDFRGKPIFTPYTWNIVKGDLVQVTTPARVKDWKTGAPLTNALGQAMTHKWFGQQGEVIAVLRKQERIVVKGVNLRTRQMRHTESSRGYQFEAESPIPYTHVTLVDPSTGKPMEGRIKHEKRVGKRGSDRIIASTGTRLPNHDRKRPGMPRVDNPRVDTPPADALAETYIKPVYARPQAELDGAGRPIVIDEEVDLTREEVIALKEKRRLTTIEQTWLETRKKTQRTTKMKDEDLELRAARMQF